MVRDSVRGYLGVASGLTEVTAARARAAARAIVEQGEETAAQMSTLAEDLVATSRRNRESLLQVVRHEIEQSLRRLGLGAASDVDALVQRVRRLERAVRELQADQSGAGRQTPVTTSATKKSVAKTSTSKKTTANKSAAKKSTARKSTTS